MEDFKIEFEKLKSKNSYKTIEQEAIRYFFGKSTQELLSGTRLNNSNETPYLNKRVGGRGGFRFYYLLIIKNNSLYLMFVHAKSGAWGSENITDESKAFLYKKVLRCIETKNLYSLSLSENMDKIVFDKL
ncbi:hypothetical protein MM236_00815 [Belliella sp. DSM 107340]|uniref:Type II toxin-antitoxin system RelE/ParE family toxin n=1 Tax=Belliella calami TaxID=2923436 RepID=A0ABS9UIQ9_9BACT|nr:hypothetical protein [Belliella calami]MCH7396501.1 hypothetical protein [Belliella calami]